MTVDDSGELTDEILFSDKTDPSSLSPADRSLSVLEQVLQSDDFIQWQDDFAGAHCSLFSLEGDLHPKCMKIYQDYVQSVEDRLLTKVRESVPTFDFEELIPVILAHKNDEDFIYAHVFEVLNAALDFSEFRSLMASYNSGEGVALDIATTKLQI
jgi:hypothetical protein